MKCGLFDGTFAPQFYRDGIGPKSATLGGECLGEHPASIEWVRDTPMPVTFFTDTNLILAPTIEDKAMTKVAWLLEPSCFSTTHYERAIELEDYFDYILCYEKDWFIKNQMSRRKWHYYPLGGSWIRPVDWHDQKKTKFCSLITTDKGRTPGHALRHKAAGMASAFPLDVMGRGSAKPIASKLEALSDYHYSVVVESCRANDYFSEKLIDCVSQHTVPIYWGCPNIGQYFNMNGIIPFEDTVQLASILVNVASNWDYSSRVQALVENHKAAEGYRCAEDWIFANLRMIFEGK